MNYSSGIIFLCYTDKIQPKKKILNIDQGELFNNSLIIKFDKYTSYKSKHQTPSLFITLNYLRKIVKLPDLIDLSMCKLYIIIKISPLIQSLRYLLRPHIQDLFFNFIPHTNLDQNFIECPHAFLEFCLPVLVVFIYYQLISILVEGMGFGMDLLELSRQRVDVFLYEIFWLNLGQANIFSKHTNLKTYRKMPLELKSFPKTKHSYNKLFYYFK